MNIHFYFFFQNLRKCLADVVTAIIIIEINVLKKKLTLTLGITNNFIVRFISYLDTIILGRRPSPCALLNDFFDSSIALIVKFKSKL